MILLNRSIEIPMPPKMDKAPPLKPVRAPIGTVGILYVFEIFKILATSSELAGFTTT